MFAFILSFLFILIILLALRHRYELFIRECFLYASVVFGLLVVVCSEALGLAHMISFAFVFAFWFAVAAILGTIIFNVYSNAYNFISLGRLFQRLKRGCICAIGNIRASLNLSEKALLLSLAFVLLLICLTAIIAPPNTWDSMTYHMPRVMHWIQNHSLENYPTNIIRQLDYPPWSEYAVMNFQILNGSDRFANLVQFFSMLGSLIAVSLIASQLGAGRSAQIIAAVIAATVPMGILQGSSTQNDYAVSFWLLCFVYFIIKAATQPRWYNISVSAASLGLCILTKGTGCIYAFPFLLWFLFNQAGKHIIFNCKATGSSLPKFDMFGIFRSLGVFALILMIASAINSGYWFRNMHLHGTILPPSESEQAINKQINIKAFAANIIKNIGMHLRTPFSRFNASVEAGIQGLIRALSDAEQPEADSDELFAFTGSLLHEDNATNLLHTLLFIVCSIIFLSKKRFREKRVARYFFLLLSSLALFNLCLRWRPYQSRYQLSLFILFAPFAAVVMDRINKKAAVAAAFILLIAGIPWVIKNQSRPLLGSKSIFITPRIEQYFANRPSLKEPYIEKCGYLQSVSCYNIGIHLGADGWEYPFWVLMKQNGAGDVRIEHIYVDNDSQKYVCLLKKFIPSAIIDFRLRDANKISLKGHDFIRTRLINKVNIFVVDTDGSLARRNLVYQMKKRQELARQIAVMPSLTKEDFRNKVIARKEELRTARLVDTEELAKIAPELAERFKKDLLKGLEMRMTGYVSSDTRCLLYGAALIKRWDTWFNANKHRYRGLF